MKYVWSILLLAICMMGQSPSPQTSSPLPSAQSSAPASSQSIPVDQANARKAKALLDQAIEALGGPAYLNFRDMEQEGRTYSFFHGQPTSAGIVFWRYVRFPDKERIELTKERDVADVFVADKGYEITYKGVRNLDTKEMTDYLRRRKYSLDWVLRRWLNEPGVALFYDGPAVAAEKPAEQVTIINSKNESVTIYFDVNTHLPIKKSFSWRDPTDKQRNIEEEIYDNYRAYGGIMTPHSLTRFFNGDMANQRFLNSVTFNQDPPDVMFDPNSGYNPNKPPKH